MFPIFLLIAFAFSANIHTTEKPCLGVYSVYANLTLSEKVINLNYDQLDVSYIDNYMTVFQYYGSQQIYTNQVISFNYLEESFFGRIASIDSDKTHTVNSIDIATITTQGTIDVQPSKTCGLRQEIDVGFCAGYNTDTCTSAKSAIPIFNNKYMTISCSNCYIGFKGDVYLSIQFAKFKLKSISGGFKNLQLNSANIISGSASASYSYAYDKVYPLIQKTPLINFNIGPININIALEVDIEVVLSAYINGGASITFGSSMQWNLGSLDFECDIGSSCVMHRPSGTPILTPILTTSAHIDGGADFKIIPTLKLIMNNVFELQVIATPDISASLSYSLATGQACISSSYDVKLEDIIDINIFGQHKTFDNVFYDSGTSQIFNKCIKV